jgi:hypothetical protein
LRLPQPGGPGSCIYIPQEQGGQPRALGSLFVASYDLQGYDEGILTHLHTGFKPSPEVEVTLRLTVGQPVFSGVEPTLGLVTKYYFLMMMYESCCLVFVLSNERLGLSFVLLSLQQFISIYIMDLHFLCFSIQQSMCNIYIQSFFQPGSIQQIKLINQCAMKMYGGKQIKIHQQKM